ncbi:MAG: hypothetical protein M1824_005676 [Vezdaea acicularis]|nr:MAG: hypothetical protein M1824_005676 [Vezdaea acicularis]
MSRTRSGAKRAPVPILATKAATNKKKASAVKDKKPGPAFMSPSSVDRATNKIVNSDKAITPTPSSSTTVEQMADILLAACGDMMASPSPSPTATTPFELLQFDGPPSLATAPVIADVGTFEELKGIVARTQGIPPTWRSPQTWSGMTNAQLLAALNSSRGNRKFKLPSREKQMIKIWIYTHDQVSHVDQGGPHATEESANENYRQLLEDLCVTTMPAYLQAELNIKIKAAVRNQANSWKRKGFFTVRKATRTAPSKRMWLTIPQMVAQCRADGTLKKAQFPASWLNQQANGNGGLQIA